MTSFWSCYYKRRTYFTSSSSVSIVDFEQVNGSWVVCIIGIIVFSEDVHKVCNISKEYSDEICI